jgi:hypothetical protein
VAANHFAGKPPASSNEVGTRYSATPHGAASSGGALPQHSKIVFCVLVEILGLDNVAVQGRVSCKREIAFIVPLRAYRRPVLVLPRTDILPVRRMPPLRLISLPLIHSVNFPYSAAHANSRPATKL